MPSRAQLVHSVKVSYITADTELDYLRMFFDMILS